MSDSNKPSPCSSCPFRDDNELEFTKLVDKLRKSFGIKESTRPFDVIMARRSVVEDALEEPVGLLCHCSVYDKDMNVDRSKATPCLGLQEHLTKLENEC